MGINFCYYEKFIKYLKFNLKVEELMISIIFFLRSSVDHNVIVACLFFSLRLATINCLRESTRSGGKATQYTENDVTVDPLTILRCDPRVFRSVSCILAKHYAIFFFNNFSYQSTLQYLKFIKSYLKNISYWKIAVNKNKNDINLAGQPILLNAMVFSS